jgi:hypothetical protein
MRWNIERRLEFIEFRLYWDGRVNRSDLVRAFNISVPQASADLTRYQELAPGNAVYDKTAKTYVSGPEFQPHFLKPSADQYLAQIRSVAAGVLRNEETWLDRLPSFAVVPLFRRPIAPGTLQTVLRTIRNHSAIRVEYQSFSRPKPIWRWIAPHSLGFDGFRWHSRAWCYEHDDFRDFVLARIHSFGESRPSDIDQSDDAEWHLQVTLRIAPHPELDPGARRAIELEYGMTRGSIEIKTQLSLSKYLERLLGLDLDPKLVSPLRQQIVLVNREEIESARQRARSAMPNGAPENGTEKRRALRPSSDT